MHQSEDLEIALAAAKSPILLESPAEVVRASKAWRRADVLGLDTEFVRERTYFANLGLVQISDGQTVWLVDPLIEGNTAPVRELLEDPDILKIFHSPSEDLEVLKHAVGAVPEPMVDTQLACAMLGEAIQMGYHITVEKIFGVEVDKGLTRSNWCARPLKQELLHYAALDVCLLPMLWALLRDRLAELGRLEWLQEDCARQVHNANNPVGPGEAWRRIKGMGTLNGTSLAMLRSLAQWREKEARKRNRPRSFIVSDPVLLNIARNKIQDLERLEDLDDLHPRARKRYGVGMTTIVATSLENGKSLPAQPQLDHRQRKQFKQLRRTTDQIASGLGVEPTLLAARKDLEQILFAEHPSSLPERLLGWRKTAVTDPLIESLADL